MIFLFGLLLMPGNIEAETIYDRTNLKVKTNNYPGNYPGNSTQAWLFRSAYGFWSIYIDRFDLQYSIKCEADYLEITDSVANFTSKYCGLKQKGNLYNSNGSVVRLIFKSDASVQHTGFHLEVLHFVREDEMTKELEKREKQKSAKLQVTLEKEEIDSRIFYALVSALGVALLVLTILSVYCIVSIIQKNRREDRCHQRNVVFQSPVEATKTRKYSKSAAPVNPSISVIRVHSRNPPRYI